MDRLQNMVQWLKQGFRLDLLVIGLLFVVVFPYSARLNNPNERTRVLQTWAIVEHGQLHIGETQRDRRKRVIFKDVHGNRSRRPFVNDIALVCDDPSKEPPRCVGKIYPAKPPGVTLLGIPALWLARTVKFIEDPPVGEPGVTPRQMHRAKRSWQKIVEAKSTWVLRYGGVVIPLLLSLLAFVALLRRAGLSPGVTRFCLWTTALGTTLLPYGLIFVGHALAGAALLAAYVLLSGAHKFKKPTLVALCGGLLAGWSVLLEYQAVAPLLGLCFWVVLTERGRRTIVGFSAGSGLALALFAWIHNAMFNSPLKTGHFFLTTAHNREGQSSGFLGVDGLHAGSLGDHLFDPYMGLAPLMPWLFVGFFAGVWALLRSTHHTLNRSDARVLVAMPLLSLLFVSTLGNWRVMNGWSIGPRYLLTVIVPMAAVASVGWAWLMSKHRAVVPLCGGLALASIAIIVTMTITFPSPTNAILSPFGELSLPLLSEGIGVKNIFMSLSESSIWWVAGLFGAAAMWSLWIFIRESGAKSSASMAIGALIIAVAFVSVLGSHQATEPKVLEKKVTGAVKVVEGVGPGTGKHTFFPTYD
jgi:hypothetical protein